MFFIKWIVIVYTITHSHGGRFSGHMRLRLNFLATTGNTMCGANPTLSPENTIHSEAWRSFSCAVGMLFIGRGWKTGQD